jgi:EmrB/QacA subfamily drug resistance transporter
MTSEIRHLRRTVFVLMLATTLSILDTTVVNVALHDLQRDLASSVADVQWVVTSYLLALAAVMPASGWACRRFGARRVYAGALALFTFGSALCAIAGSLPMLVVSRALQGVGGGMILPTTQLIGARAAGPRRVGWVMSRVWMVTSLSGVLGPVVGGLILDGFGWRWIFLINVPIGIAAITAVLLLLPDIPAAAGRFDFAGFVMLGIGLPALVFGLAEAATSGDLQSATALVPLLLGGSLLIAFVRHALRRNEHPLLDVRLYAHSAFAAGTGVLCSQMFAWSAVLVLVPLFLQQVQRTSAALTGLLMASQGIGSFLGMLVISRIGDRRAGLRLGITGLGVFAAVTMLLARADSTTPHWVFATIMLVEGVASGIAWVPLIAEMYADLRPEQVFDAAPLMSVMTRIGASLGTAAAAIVLQNELAGHASTLSHITSAYGIAFAMAGALSATALVPYSRLLAARRRLASGGTVATHALKAPRGASTALAADGLDAVRDACTTNDCGPAIEGLDYGGERRHV